MYEQLLDRTFIIPVSAPTSNLWVKTHLPQANTQKPDQKCEQAVKATMDTDSQTQGPKPRKVFLQLLVLWLQMKPWSL